MSPHLCIPPSLHTNLLILPSSNTVATIIPQQYQSIFSEVYCLKEKFVALENENQWLLEDLQQNSLDNLQMQQQYGELVLCVQQLEATIVSLQQ